MTTKAPQDNQVNINFNDPLVRYKIFADRTGDDQEQLLNDIDIWHKKLEETTTKHHVGQFLEFCKRVFAQVNDDYGRSEEDVIFKSQVIGTLTTQWLSLREVAAHHLAGSPYLDVLNSLEKEAARYYRSVLKALPEKTSQNLPKSPPLIFLGRAAELTFFNDQNQTPPALISVPFGVINDPPQARSRLSIAHEVGHAVFTRVRPFLPELDAKLHSPSDRDAEPTHQQRVVRSVIINWVGEIVADLVGMALVGPTFAESAFTIIAGPEAYLGITDETHPVPIIRPYIYLEFLEYLEKKISDKEIDTDQVQVLQNYTDQTADLRAKINGFSSRYLERPFESLPALTKVTLNQVGEALRSVTRSILNITFDSLNANRFGEILINCAVNMYEANQADINDEELILENWGSTIQISSPFVLDLSNLLAPTYATPVTIGDFIKCCVLRRCPC